MRLEDRDYWKNLDYRIWSEKDGEKQRLLKGILTSKWNAAESRGKIKGLFMLTQNEGFKTYYTPKSH